MIEREREREWFRNDCGGVGDVIVDDEDNDSRENCVTERITKNWYIERELEREREREKVKEFEEEGKS